MSALPTAGPLDEDLAAAIAAGDDAAFEELYRRYARPLAGYAGRILRDRVAGEDVAQVALLNAYQALRRGSRPTFVRAWLYRIARNAALETRERRGDVVPLEEGDATAESTFDVHTARADLVTAVRALPDRQRSVYALRELQGLRVAEIAERLALTTEQVEQALFAARNKLAERLEFGERLDCASVQNLAEARLSRAQLRAVKSHLRSCTSCRTSPRIPVGLATLPLAWLRDGLAAVFAGGAAKTAAVVAAAAVAGSIPVVAKHAPSIPVLSYESTSPRAGAPAPPRARDDFSPRFLGTETPFVVPAKQLGRRDIIAEPATAIVPPPVSGARAAPESPEPAVGPAVPVDEPQPAAEPESQAEPEREVEEHPVDAVEPAPEEHEAAVEDGPVEPEPVDEPAAANAEREPEPVVEPAPERVVALEPEPAPEPAAANDATVAPAPNAP
jgi:RNA polymerase sigma factor (sigma-70 family)